MRERNVVKFRDIIMIAYTAIPHAIAIEYFEKKIAINADFFFHIFGCVI